MAVLEKDALAHLQEQLIRRAWEEDDFAELLRTNPRQAIVEETGVELPGHIDIQVHQEDETSLHLVIPRQPSLPAEPRSAHIFPTANCSSGTVSCDVTQCTRRACVQNV